MNQDRVFKALWQETTANLSVNIELDKLLRSLLQARNRERLSRAYEYTDLFGGFVLLLIVSTISILNPGFVSTLDHMAVVGIIMGFATFLTFHVCAFIVRRSTLVGHSDLRSLLEAEISQLNRRIRFSKNLVYFLVPGLFGVFILFHSLTETWYASLLSGCLLLLLGSILYALAMRDVKRVYEPSLRQADSDLETLVGGLD